MRDRFRAARIFAAANEILAKLGTRREFSSDVAKNVSELESDLGSATT